ncbi:MAG: cyclic nucleotide-binding domain-containing protein [Gammaproteobacteria bacterium]|nr:cyclic nucleotide-binding domain-containing protein [Gammaproteobacteria bacterium]MDH5261960.1 cyclic nucleotide-binding domain-containing protein [Gammaproteobacteria bacterium]
MNTTSKEILDSRLGFELSDNEATKLASLMQAKELRGGDYLIVEDTTDDSLYVIVEGNLEVVKRTAGDSVASIAIVREGQLAGELSFLDSNVHTVGLRALSDTKVLALAREDFEKIIDGDPQLVYKVMRAVARSAHRIMHQMNHEFIELSNYIFKQHGRY